MKIHSIVPVSKVDGPATRTVVFMQGCTLACPGCQNQHLWEDVGENHGPLTLARNVAVVARKNNGRLTVSGGEPFQQAEALADFLAEYHDCCPHGHVVVYTGYTWEELWDCTPSDLLAAILDRIDVLVDGRFERQQDSPLMQWRGSANQRPIDVQRTLLTGSVQVLDWDTPRIIIGQDGDLTAPVGLKDIAEHATGRKSAATRRCGQTR